MLLKSKSAVAGMQVAARKMNLLTKKKGTSRSKPAMLTENLLELTTDIEVWDQRAVEDSSELADV